MSDDSDSKTEEPTEKRLSDALDRGDAPVSREIPILAALAALLVALALIAPTQGERLAAALAHFIDDPADWRLTRGEDALALLRLTLGAAAAFLAPILALIAVAGLSASFAQNPPRIVAERIAPDPQRLSPRRGAARIFGPRGWTDFGKGLVKLAAVATAAAIVIAGEREALIGAVYADIGDLPQRLLAPCVRVVAAVLTATLVVAGADFTAARILWRRDQRMSRREIKDEMRQMEGDRLMKSRLRSLRLDRTRKRMLAAVPRATMVIVNPTHCAVALRYVRAEGGAPKVLAKGVDLIALKIRELAEGAGLPIVEDRPLARSLYDSVAVDSVIPPEFYRAVAGIVHLIQQRKGSWRPAPLPR